MNGGFQEHHMSEVHFLPIPLLAPRLGSSVNRDNPTPTTLCRRKPSSHHHLAGGWRDNPPRCGYGLYALVQLGELILDDWDAGLLEGVIDA